MALQRRGGFNQDGPIDLSDDPNSLIAAGGGNLGAGSPGLGTPGGGAAPSVPSPDPSAAPNPSLDPGQAVGPPDAHQGGSTMRSPELNPGAANPNVSRVGTGGNSQGTPPMPASPDPVSSQPPQPFQPIAPGMSDQAAATSDVSRVNPFGGPSMASSGILSRAGGLLGGGLGLTGTNPDHGNDPYGNPDVQTLLKLLGAQ